MAVKYLLVIQSSGSSETHTTVKKNNSINVPRPARNAVKSPRWLQAACGSLLSQRLMQNNGVVNVIR